MAKDEYTVIVSTPAREALHRHVEFLARVSIPAAKRLSASFRKELQKLAKDPYPYTNEDSPALPSNTYKKAFISQWHKLVFLIDKKYVFIDYVVDCRQSDEKSYKN